MPAGGLEHLTRGLAVVREKCGTFVKLFGIDPLERVGHGDVGTCAPIGELGRVGHLLSERVLEGVLLGGVRHSPAEDLKGRQIPKRRGKLRFGHVRDLAQH